MRAGIPISLHCWQGDDVTGFENNGEALVGGLPTTGNYPGKARNAAEMRVGYSLWMPSAAMKPEYWHSEVKVCRG